MTSGADIRRVLRPGKLRTAAILMMLAIIGIAAFQGYWFKKLYDEEWAGLKKETSIAFRDVLFKLHLQQFRKDTVFSKHVQRDDVVYKVQDSFKDKLPAPPLPGTRQMSFSFMTDGGRDTIKRGLVEKVEAVEKVIPSPDDPDHGPLPFILKFLTAGDSVGFPLPVGLMDSAYKKELLKNKIDVPFVMQRLEGSEHDLERQVSSNEREMSFIFVGRSKAYAYQATFASPFGYILNRLRLPLLMGVALLAFTTLAFVFLYRNLRQQQQLAAIKNEFISNMTHELKTPISTVKVAVEALRHFDALNDPQKTREYLDISALELQRLSMLVDKVLKLSLFENKEIELNKSLFDMRELAAEVIANMRLQMEKAGAFVQIGGEGTSFMVKADRAHLGSVMSNLLDNALKYSRETPAITVDLINAEENVLAVTISDNGIGIPAAYIGRVFEKFFRVPSDDRHNIKGYGLGLSYVHHIIVKHNGTIAVESKEGKGTAFTFKLPIA